MAEKTPARAAAPPNNLDAALTQSLGQRLRTLRKQRHWTLEELAAASGVSRSMLSQIERQRANPTLGVAFRIARAFGLTLSNLVEESAAPPMVDVVRGSDRASHFRNDKQCRIRTLSPLHLEKDVEFYEVLLRAAGTLSSTPHFAGTRELLTVQKGAVRVRTADAVCELSAGDSAYYPADVPHSIRNIGRGEALTFLVVTYAAD